MKQKFIDAYTSLYGGTKKQANNIYKTSSNTYINTVIGWFDDQSKLCFYND